MCGESQFGYATANSLPSTTCVTGSESLVDNFFVDHLTIYHTAHSPAPLSNTSLAAASRLTVLENTLQKTDDRCAGWDFGTIFSGSGAVF